MYRFIAGVAALLLASEVVFADAASDKAQSIVRQNCAACHGAAGNSALPANPKLAGQHFEYLLKQMQEFKALKRDNPVMMGMLVSIGAEDLAPLARYFADRKSAPGAASDKSLALQGEAIYRAGIASKSVPACAGCHSPNGAGIPAQYPRLAGQHADYLVAQLQAFRAGKRSNDLNEMMRNAAANLSDGEIAAVTQYISGLR